MLWGEPVQCEVDFVCKDTDCQELSASQKAQIGVLKKYSDHLRDYTGFSAPLDFEMLKASATQAISLGEGDDYTFAKAIYSIYRAVPQGHSALGLGAIDWSDCQDPEAVVPMRARSWYGVCARSAGDAAIITFAGDDNPMGLLPGDRIVSITRDGETWEGPHMLDRVGEEPLCNVGVPSKSGLADFNALHVFSIINSGDTLEVIHADDSSQNIIVPQRGDLISCTDPFFREESKALFASHQREDGVVVIVLPTMGNHPDHPFPKPLKTLQQYRDWNAEAISLLNDELGNYDDIKGLVWDIRGNRGGAAEYGMGIFGLGDVAGGLGKCYHRIVGSSPPQFSDTAKYTFPYQIFVDQPLPALAFPGKQALIIDGTATSAADWMVYRARALGLPVIGHGGTGAYGYRTGSSYVHMSIDPVEDLHIGVDSYVSGAHCLDSNGKPLEGNAPVSIILDYDPKDLAAGVDTLLEAAVLEVLLP